MLPEINFSKTFLDTSIVFSTKTYNYYNIKSKGLTGAVDKLVKEPKEPVPNPIASKNLDRLGSPQKMSSGTFVLDAYKVKPRSNTVFFNSDLMKNYNQLSLFNSSNFIRQKRSLPRLQSPEKPKHNRTRGCCNKNIPKVHTEKDLTRILEQKLFKEIKDDDIAERTQMMKLRGKDKLANYTSSALQDEEKWGTNGKQVRRGFSTFGRNLKRFKRQEKVQEYSREELQRLALGDVKLYIPSHADYIRNYTKEIVKELLLQSNTGAKYREPCD